MKLKDLCESERPREKLLCGGVKALSNGELLAVLLRSACGNDNVMDLSQRLLSAGGGRLDNLFSMSTKDLESFYGIGPAKAATVMAAFELGRRYMQEKAENQRRAVVDARVVYEIMIPRLKGLDHEEGWLMYLDGMNRFSGAERLTVGGFDSTVLDLRQSVKRALEKGAAAVVLVHNHPSGEVTPSPADCALTESMRKGMNAVGITLVDHVVVSDRGYFSFCDNAATIL